MLSKKRVKFRRTAKNSRQKEGMLLLNMPVWVKYRRFSCRLRAARRRQVPAAPAVRAPRHAARSLHRHPTTQRHSLVSRPGAVTLVVAVAAVSVGAAVDAPGRLHHHPVATRRYCQHCPPRSHHTHSSLGHRIPRRLSAHCHVSVNQLAYTKGN